LFGNTVGIIGLGRVGRLVAHYCSAFGAQVFFYDTDTSLPDDAAIKRQQTLPELIQKTNIIVLCASYEHTRKEPFISNYTLNLMKDKYFINTARGELVDEKALITHIRSNHFKGVAIDVITDETNKNNNRSALMKAAEGKNVIVTPHIAGATFESMHKTEFFIVEQLVKKLKG